MSDYKISDVRIVASAWVANQYNISCVASRDGKQINVSFTMDTVEPLKPCIKTLDAVNDWIMPYLMEHVEG